METASDDDIIAHDDGSHCGIGADPAEALGGEHSSAVNIDDENVVESNAIGLVGHGQQHP